MVSGVRLDELTNKSILRKGLRQWNVARNAAWNATGRLGTRTLEEISLLQVA